MRLAFVDTLFSWPPHGGACADVYHTASALQAEGHEVRLFCAVVDGAWERAGFGDGSAPFPVTPLRFTERSFTQSRVRSAFREAVDAWRPEAVFIADAFAMKPHVMDALSAYPQAVRYFAYEFACPRDFRRYLNGAPCPLDYVRTPSACLRCAVDAMGPAMRRGRWPAFEQEFIAAGAHTQAYYDLARRTLGRAKAVVVYNRLQASLLAPWTDRVHIVPGGVEPVGAIAEAGEEDGVATVLMAGRCEDPTKGLAVLREAGARLALHRSDFRIAATVDGGEAAPWFEPVGWRSPEALRALWRRAAIAAFPSVWDEPFGIVAVEAMAMGKPVIASAVGGLVDIVADGETGFAVPPGDAGALAECIAALLDDPDLRRRMGAAGRARAEREYTWPAIVARHYPAIIEALAT